MSEKIKQRYDKKHYKKDGVVKMVVGVTMLNVLPGKEKIVYDEILSYEGIKDLYHVFGEFDFVVVISTETLKELNDLVDRIRAIPNVTATQTIIGADI